MVSFELLCEDKSQQLGLFVELGLCPARNSPYEGRPCGCPRRRTLNFGVLLVRECGFSVCAPGGRPSLIMLLLSVDGAEVLASKDWGPGELSLFEASKTNSPLQNGQVLRFLTVQGNFRPPVSMSFSASLPPSPSEYSKRE